jgi:hypothetical protein
LDGEGSVFPLPQAVKAITPATARMRENMGTLRVR